MSISIISLYITFFPRLSFKNPTDVGLFLSGAYCSGIWARVLIFRPWTRPRFMKLDCDWASVSWDVCFRNWSHAFGILGLWTTYVNFRYQSPYLKVIFMNYRWQLKIIFSKLYLTVKKSKIFVYENCYLSYYVYSFNFFLLKNLKINLESCL